MDETQPLNSNEVRTAADRSQPVVLVGDLDAGTTGPIRRQLFDLIGSGVTDLVLDMSAVNFIDSSGITLLLQCRAHANLVIRAPSSAVRQVLTITRVTDVLTIHD